MAYKPKYLRGKETPSKSRPAQKTPEAKREPVRREPPREEVHEKATVGQIILGCLLVPACLVLTVLLLGLMAGNVGAPGAQVDAKRTDIVFMDRFDAMMAEALDPVRDALTAPPQSGGEGDAPQETIEVPKKVYTLNDEDLVAPEPNQALFGSTEDPDVLRAVIAQAADLLDGQTLYFDPDRERAPTTEVRYYLDDTIFALTWKEGHDGAAYTMSEVKIAHASQLRRHLADGEYGSSKQYYTTEMAATVNAVVASAGDFYNFRDWGTEVYQGQVRGLGGSYSHTCYINDEGDMLFTYPKPFANMEEAQAFVDENGIRFSLCFGPILVDNYEAVELPSGYYLGEPKEEYARGALCQMDKLHYLSVTANFDKGHNRCPTVATFQKHIAATGCKMAYCLDGGQTATIVMNDELINRPAKGEQRRISDIIYYATAIPEGG